MSHSAREESGSKSITECQESRSSRKRKAYSIDKKLEAVDYARQYSKNSAAKKFNVGRTLIIDWVKKEKELRESQKGSKRLAGAERHLSFAELDEELARWVREQRAAKNKVSRRIIQQQAVKTFVPEDNEKKFKVSVLTTGHDKLRVTVMLTARSDGFKCLPYVLLPRKRVDPMVVEKFKRKLHLTWEGTTWMNDPLTEDYLTRVIGQLPSGKRLLIWDSFRCHISEATKKRLKWCRADTAVVPGGCTKFLQAPDVCWNSPFKAKIHELYDDWMMHGEKEVTKEGNPKAAPMATYLQWIVEAWESISKELIVNSFKACGIINAIDGSEDDEIHCFKPDGVVPSGRAKLQQARADKELAHLLEEIDLEQEKENLEYDSDISLEC